MITEEQINKLIQLLEIQNELKERELELMQQQINNENRKMEYYQKKETQSKNPFTRLKEQELKRMKEEELQKNGEFEQ